MRTRVSIALGLVALATLGLAAPALAIPDCGRRPEVRVLVHQSGKMESVGIDSRGRLFFTNSDAGKLFMLKRPGGKPRLVAQGIDAPGGIIFKRRSGHVLVGFGDSIAQATDGTLNPEAGLLNVDPRTGETKVKVDGLQMANGVARGPHATIYASTDIGDRRRPHPQGQDAGAAVGEGAERERDDRRQRAPEPVREPDLHRRGDPARSLRRPGRGPRLLHGAPPRMRPRASTASRGTGRIGSTSPPTGPPRSGV